MSYRIFPKGSRRREIVKKLFVEPQIPTHISENFRKIDKSGLDKLRISLEQNFFADYTREYQSSEQGKHEMSSHLLIRLEKSRKLVVPWLDHFKPIAEANILEIGCGTGASTVALAEQGARVTAIDMDENSLNVAKERCRIYGVNVTFVKVNATEVHRSFSNQHFDFVIFFSCLQHMIYEERMTAMKNTWDMLSPGDLWCVVDSPNRLWYYDFHTSFLPFFMWLPNDLAFRYSRFSPRINYRELYRNYDEASKLRFLRRARGVSFHEFELAIKPLEQLNVISSMPIFYRRQRIANWLKSRFSLEHRYESFLCKVCPNIHRGFYQKNLSLVIRRD